MSKTATPQGPAGLFATARRGGLTGPEIKLVEQLRSGDRPVSWQNIARRLGRCEIDVRALFAEPEPEAPDDTVPKLFPWNEPQVAYLKARFEPDGPDAVAALLGCSRRAVVAKAQRLGLSTKNAHARRIAA